VAGCPDIARPRRCEIVEEGVVAIDSPTSYFDLKKSAVPE
jgi:hypothetical protein